MPALHDLSQAALDAQHLAGDPAARSDASQATPAATFSGAYRSKPSTGVSPIPTV